MTTASIGVQIQEIMRRPYHRLVWGEPNEGYLAEVLEFPGCFTAGDTPVEAMQLLEDAMEGWLTSCLMHGDTIPEPAPATIINRTPQHAELLRSNTERVAS